VSLVREQPVFGVLLNEFPNQIRDLGCVSSSDQGLAIVRDSNARGGGSFLKDEVTPSNQASFEVNRTNSTVHENAVIFEAALQKRSIVQFDLMVPERLSSVAAVLVARRCEKGIESVEVRSGNARHRRTCS
jgi:hypothetical protein